MFCSRVPNIAIFLIGLVLFCPSLVLSKPLDPVLAQTYAAMHDDCMSSRYLNDDLVKAMFVEMDTLKVMELLRERNIQSLAERYLDPKLLEKERRKIRKTYQKWDSLLDLKGRGLSYEDLCNAYLAAGLLLYRYMHTGAAGYGVIPEKEWTQLAANAWRLTFSYGKKIEHFYFRQVGTNWYLTDKHLLNQ